MVLICSCIFNILTSLSLTITPLYYPHFPEEETEACRSEVTFLREVTEARLLEPGICFQESWAPWAICTRVGDQCLWAGKKELQRDQATITESTALSKSLRASEATKLISKGPDRSRTGTEASSVGDWWSLPLWSALGESPHSEEFWGPWSRRPPIVLEVEFATRWSEWGSETSLILSSSKQHFIAHRGLWIHLSRIIIHLSRFFLIWVESTLEPQTIHFPTTCL